MEAPFVFGLPTSQFDLALLWEPVRPIRRRLAREGNSHEGDQWSDFPTWSWCGWSGRSIGYRNSLLEEPPSNLHEWLTKHTWINWFLRDGHGNLRPLWKGGQSTYSRQADKRWRGYQSVPADSEPPPRDAPRAPRNCRRKLHEKETQGDPLVTQDGLPSRINNDDGDGSDSPSYYDDIQDHSLTGQMMTKVINLLHSKLSLMRVTCDLGHVPMKEMVSL